ncbi:MAG: hypothetical protein KatS3mg027_0599 [Bacteroidia bacterium]|nr:MAG: hypothetical protein KatS3mg027_0599 [Bacteroidia bacterium]
MSENLKIKTIGNRISIAESYSNDNKIWSLVILPYIDKWRYWALIAWVIAWTVCGILIISSYKLTTTNEQKLFIIVFVVFWLYYEWKMIQIFRWRKWGKEKLWIKNNELFYEESILKKSKTFKWKIEHINEVAIEEFNEKSFTDFISNSFWNKGKPRIRINVLGKNYYLGYQLNDNEVVPIVKSLKHQLNSILKN